MRRTTTPAASPSSSHRLKVAKLALLCLVVTLSSCQSTKKPSAPNGETVVLLHGLLRSARSMEPMANHLREHGYTVINHNYPSRHHTIEKIIELSIAPLMESPVITLADKLHFVTHSMGGILVRSFLKDTKPANLGRVVMFGPPNGGSEVVDKIGHWHLFASFNGPAGQQLGTDGIPASLGPVDFPLGIIAGDRSINWINSSMIPGPDDGKVSVEGTKVEGMTDHTVVHYTHPLMMRRNSVIELAERFLRTGSFRAE